MVYNDRLGYDPDEWEECPEPEHFLVFSPFTRYVLTAAAIAFVYYFFKLLDEHKNGPRVEEEQPITQTTVENVLEGASQKLAGVKERMQEIPSDAEDLLREADQYLRNTTNNLVANGNHLAENMKNKFPSLELNINMSQPVDATKETFDNTLNAVNNHLNETLNMDLSPKSHDSTQFEQISDFVQDHDFEHIPAHLKQTANQYYAEQRPPPVPQHQVPISPTEQKLLQEFDIYDGPSSQYQGGYSQQPPQQQQQFVQQQQPQPIQVLTQLPQQYDLSQLSPNSRAAYDKQLSPSSRGAFAPVAKREKRLSEQDERALQDWEQEKALLEADRIKKLLDHEAGGDSNTDLSSSQKAYDHFAPATHISYDSHSPEAALQPLTPTAGKNSRLAQLQQLAPQNMNNVRDSQLTDYDISDFNAHESNWSEPPYQQLPHQQQQQPQRIEESQRRTTNDSDDYVKVNEPIYDYPPRAAEKKRISPTEAAQLQELCQEYDLGLDIPGVQPQQQQQAPVQQQQRQYPFRNQQDEQPIQQQFYQQQQQYQQPALEQHGYPQSMQNQQFPPQQQGYPQSIQHQQHFQDPQQGYPPSMQNQQQFQPQQPGYQQPVQHQQQFQQPQQGFQQVDPFKRQDSQPQTVVNVPIGRPPQQPQQYNVPIKTVPNNAFREDTRNQATADMFVQDALEYLGKQDKPASAFVMEEDMLRSHEEPRKSLNKVPSIGGEATSRQVRTNDVFERVETDEHDDMTYAPEIQSVMIPPDQMSETSENIIDYFDKVAADSEAQINDLRQNTLKKQKRIPADNTKTKPVGRAPQILPAFGNRATSNSSLGSGRSGSAVSSDGYPYRNLRKQSSLLSVLGVTSMQEMLLTINSLDALSEAMRRAGLETTNLIFGIDYTASNKYQGEDSFGGRSLHTIHPNVKNPYQQVITILGRTLAPFAGHGNIGVYGFGDAKTGDWSTFNLKSTGDCRSLDEVLSVYNAVTPNISLSGPTNFAPLIYQAMETCQKSRDYHILVIIADGQVTNERATRRAIVQACQHPLSIIVVGVGDGPWDMMKIFDESLPKRPWDNFHFVEFHEIVKKATSLEDGDVKVAVQSLLEIPDQYRCICELGLLDRSIPPRGSEIRRELMHNPL